MKTIREFLESYLYLDILKELGVDNFSEELRSIEIERLINRLKQKQFLIEGYNYKLHSEKELVEFYKQTIEENRSDIILWSKQFWQYSNDTVEEYPDGEFPEGEEIDEEDKSTVISKGKYSITSIAMYIIEFDILKNYSEILADYYKRLRIPGAVRYAREMKKLYKKVFKLNSRL